MQELTLHNTTIGGSIMYSIVNTGHPNYALLGDNTISSILSHIVPSVDILTASYSDLYDSTKKNIQIQKTVIGSGKCTDLATITPNQEITHRFQGIRDTYCKLVRKSTGRISFYYTLSVTNEFHSGNPIDETFTAHEAFSDDNGKTWTDRIIYQNAGISFVVTHDDTTIIAIDADIFLVQIGDGEYTEHYTNDYIGGIVTGFYFEKSGAFYFANKSARIWKTTDGSDITIKDFGNTSNFCMHNCGDYIAVMLYSEYMYRMLFDDTGELQFSGEIGAGSFCKKSVHGKNGIYIFFFDNGDIPESTLTSTCVTNYPDGGKNYRNAGSSDPNPVLEWDTEYSLRGTRINDTISAPDYIVLSLNRTENNVPNMYIIDSGTLKTIAKSHIPNAAKAILML